MNSNEPMYGVRNHSLISGPDEIQLEVAYTIWEDEDGQVETLDHGTSPLPYSRLGHGGRIGVTQFNSSQKYMELRITKVDQNRWSNFVKTTEAELDNLLEKKKITLKEYKEEIKKLAGYSETGIEAFSHRNEDIEIKKLLNHYYFPSIVSKKDRIKWMKHIVDIQSEVTFLKALEKHLKTKENFFTEFDWWMFSKVDHTLDKQIRIPYIDPANGKRDFLPDFVFWLQKGKDYHILYIDPKGTGRSEYQYKVDGYRDLFEDSDKVKTFKFSGKNFKVHLRLATEDKSVFAEKDYYKKYWVEPDDFNIKLDE
jgi:hypothetical protein